MQNTSDIIELFLKELIESKNGELELKRNELAGQFNCAPSQINYVLATRFTANRGYIVTSRKGGGGFIRITSIDMSRNEYILHIIDRIGTYINESEAIQVLNGLYERNIISKREARLIDVSLSDEALGGSMEECCTRRAATLKNMMLVLMNSDNN